MSNPDHRLRLFPVFHRRFTNTELKKHIFLFHQGKHRCDDRFLKFAGQALSLGGQKGMNERKLKRNRKLRILCGCLALFTANEAVAQEVLVSPGVVAVVEGGPWKEERLGEGSYRVAVVNQVFVTRRGGTETGAK